MYNPRTWTKRQGLLEGMGVLSRVGQRGKNWDICNRISNKIYFKKQESKDFKEIFKNKNKKGSFLKKETPEKLRTLKVWVSFLTDDTRWCPEGRWIQRTPFTFGTLPDLAPWASFLAGPNWILYNKTVTLSIVLSWVLSGILANCQT